MSLSFRDLIAQGILQVTFNDLVCSPTSGIPSTWEELENACPTYTWEDMECGGPYQTTYEQIECTNTGLLSWNGFVCTEEQQVEEDIKYFEDSITFYDDCE